MALQDMNNYLYKLVTQDLGFGQQIEDSIRKIQIQKEMDAMEREAAANDGIYELSEEEHEDFYEEIQEQLKSDKEFFEHYTEEDGWL